MEVTIGRIVLYTLGDADARLINHWRTDAENIPGRILEGKWIVGAQAHVGNQVAAGEQFPMLVVKIWSPGCVNGQVFLDGSDCLWVTSVSEGLGSNTWRWPPRS